MKSCSGCVLRLLRKKYGKRLVKHQGSWYKTVLPGRGVGTLDALPDGTPIKFVAWFKSEEHTNDERCVR